MISDFPYGKAPFFILARLWTEVAPPGLAGSAGTVLATLGAGAILTCSVVAARPDLVHGARGRLPALELRTPEVVP